MAAETGKNRISQASGATNGRAAKEAITISAPNMQVAEFEIEGIAPLVLHAFGAKQRKQMRDTQEAGSTAKKGSKREPKDFQREYEDACHVSEEDWHGIPASALRAAMIRACSLCGFHMTVGKVSVFVLPDGKDRATGDDLVRITHGEPSQFEAVAKNTDGSADIRVRPRWEAGWKATVRVRYDADQFTVSDVANLLLRAGMQVGIGEGRPCSRKGTGMGWGLFQFSGDSDD